MQLKKAKELAAKILGVGKSKVWINPKETQAIKEAITKEDLKELIKKNIIKKSKKQWQSRARARKLKEKKKKGRKKGQGSRKAKKTLRMGKKRGWINKVRALRRTLRELKQKNKEAIEKIGYQKLYKMIKGNYFKGKKYLIKFVEGQK